MPVRPDIPDFELRTTGPVPGHGAAALHAELASTLEPHQGSVEDLRARITRTGESFGVLAVVQVNLRWHGHDLRVQTTGATVAAAIASNTDRLTRQLHRLALEAAWPWPDPSRTTLGVEKPAEITRHKTVSLRCVTPDRAREVLWAMDYDAHLFTDEDSGEDAIVYRAGPGGVRLNRQRSMYRPAGHLDSSTGLTLHPLQPPTLPADRAAQWLTRHGLPHLFFTNATTGRGNLAYRRFDGNLTLIQPDESPEPPRAR